MPISATGSVRRLGIVFVAVALLVTLAPAPPAEALTQAEIRTRVYKRINNARRNHGVRALRVDSTVQSWAQRHARDMAAADTLYHDPALALELSKVTAIVWAYGENVGVTSTGPRAPRRIHRMFMRSPPHRENILRRRFTHMGLGVIKRDGRIWIVQRFVDLRP